jgi:hypothetical protein
MEQRRGGRSGVKPVAVFRFLSEDWSPWIALVRMRKRWPELRFDMKAGYLQYAGATSRPGRGRWRPALRSPAPALSRRCERIHLTRPVRLGQLSGQLCSLA